jgi:hypothetical protein
MYIYIYIPNIANVDCVSCDDWKGFVWVGWILYMLYIYRLVSVGWAAVILLLPLVGWARLGSAAVLRNFGMGTPKVIRWERRLVKPV